MAPPAEGELKHGSYEVFILALSLLSIVNLVLVAALPLEQTKDIIRSVDYGLSVVFLGDFAYRLLSAASKSGYFIRQFGFLDLLGSLPLPYLRLARLLRVARVILLIQWTGPRRLWWAIVRERAASTLLTLLFFTVVLLEVASTAMLAIEIRDPHANIRTSSDALWWTYVTITTVGYGDVYPVTNEGRLVGVVTLTFGVGLFGAITAFLANFFLRPGAGAGTAATGHAADRQNGGTAQ